MAQAPLHLRQVNLCRAVPATPVSNIRVAKMSDKPDLSIGYRAWISETQAGWNDYHRAAVRDHQDKVLVDKAWDAYMVIYNAAEAKWHALLEQHGLEYWIPPADGSSSSRRETGTGDASLSSGPYQWPKEPDICSICRRRHGPEIQHECE